MDGNIKTHNQDPKGNMDEGGCINDNISKVAHRPHGQSIIRNKKTKLS